MRARAGWSQTASDDRLLPTPIQYVLFYRDVMRERKKVMEGVAHAGFVWHAHGQPIGTSAPSLIELGV